MLILLDRYVGTYLGELSYNPLDPDASLWQSNPSQIEILEQYVDIVETKKECVKDAHTQSSTQAYFAKLRQCQGIAFHQIQNLSNDEKKRKAHSKVSNKCEFDLDHLLNQSCECEYKMDELLRAASWDPTWYKLFKTKKLKKAEKFWESCVPNLFQQYKRKQSYDKVIFCLFELPRIVEHYKEARIIYPEFEPLSLQDRDVAAMKEFCQLH
jgi:hypothetical protein